MGEHEKRCRSYTEDHPSTDDDDDEEGGLDISQYISKLTQTQTQTQDETAGKEAAIEIADSDDDDAFSDPQLAKKTTSSSKPAPKQKRRVMQSATPSESEEASGADIGESDFDMFDDDMVAAYKQFKNRRTLKRKRVAAETKRIRADKKSKTNAATSIIGRKQMVKKARKDVERSVLTGSDHDEGNDAYLDDPTPDYIDSRRRKMKKLHQAGLLYPPSYEGIEFSGPDSEERPVLSGVKPQRSYEDIQLRESLGVIPASIAQWLRDYQIDGVRFLHERFVRQTGALLGDDMGLGKTIQVIAFLTAAFGKTASESDAKRMRKVRRLGDGGWYPRILIVCPGTLMQNWEDELEKWGWWDVHKYHGNTREKKAVLDAARKGMVEIMITTYTTYRMNESQINTVDWDCVIADECHQIKSKDAEITKAMNKVNALCRIGLTGTAIQNKYEELWALLNWVKPGGYGSSQEWKQLISRPLKLGQAHDATNEQLGNARAKAQELVTKVLPDVFLRRMKTLIADQLPKKSDRVVFCPLTETQAEAYRTLVESETFEYVRRANEPCDCDSGKKRGWCCYIEIPGKGKWAYYTFPCMQTLQKLSNHLALLLPLSSDSSEKQAKDLENLQIACPDDWKDYYRIKDSIFSQSQREFCGKWKVLKRLLDFWHSNGDKVLVFSHSVRLLRLLKSLFDIDGTKYNFSYLDGSMSYDDRSKAVADFNSNPTQFVFLISTKAGGVGLNITSANKVVVVDPNWNPAYDLQAQDRAYRIGQTRDVEVFRLVSSGTIEEIVYARQIYKQQQANIGYTASDERRYFKGVMDDSGKKGELFGLTNLFTFAEDGLLLRDIVHQTNVAETRAGVKAMDFEAVDEGDFEDEDDDWLSDKALGLDEDDGSEVSQMKKFAEIIASGGSEKVNTRGRKKYTKRAGPDPINAILAKAGVQYTHENSEVIGRSEIEAKLSRKAMELRGDLELGGERVFQFSQSQSQQQSLEFEEEGRVEDSEAEVEVDGRKGGREEFKIHYRYRPKEDVRRRQFCSIAKAMGFEDPVEFALEVEDMTLEERRKVLDKFYRKRRREIAVELGGRG
ncbi:SNF2 family N-terminal domain-domain-containing protein [Clohesyomyces aquaticus]|uniref:SNF2 family N-terminal domain-domain-containing protein n=1 Tax=Clohesyomyces aquaticus TaxID=1231657 RepID=A0A1Y1Z9V7_9PLEO|nr:SNF2 family N-terminal domain-domain-containing protein [Clohesyomyces aquaticus]